MSEEKRTQIVDALLASQAQLTEFFESVADPARQPAPGQWSIRQIAWHLATVESGCLLVRIQQIAAGTNPTFGIYLDTETEFNRRGLAFALEEWAHARQAVVSFVNGLPAEALAYTGNHPTFGRLTVLGYLQIFLDHDQRHLEELQALDVVANRKS
jgi:hypothetical protein